MTPTKEYEPGRPKFPLLIKNGAQWNEQIGTGLLQEPVRLLFTHPHNSLYPFGVGEYFFDDYIAESPVLVFPFNADDTANQCNLFYRHHKAQRLKDFKPALRIDKVEGENLWQVWIEDEGEVLPLSLDFGHGEGSHLSTDKMLMPATYHTIVMGPKTEAGDLFIIEGLTISNPYESHLPNGEHTIFTHIGVGNIRFK